MTKKKTIAHVGQNSGNDEWYTPAIYPDAARRVMGSIDLDPASTAFANTFIRATMFYTKETDGLGGVWCGNVWCNPPYAYKKQNLITSFCDALVSKFKSGEISQACLLINNASETARFQRVFRACTAMCMVQGRIRFICGVHNHERGHAYGELGDAPLQGQVIFYFGPNRDAFVREFNSFGAIATPC